MIKTIIFDFDGVILESLAVKTDAFKKLFICEGEAVAERVADYHLKNSGVSRFEKFKYIYDNMLKRELREEVFDSLCQRFSQLVFSGVTNSPFVAGVEDFLKSFYARYKFFLISATPQEELKEIVKKRQLAGFFAEIYGAPLDKIKTVRQVLEKHALLPSEVVYVGDSLSDWEAADKNSVNFIARINDNEDLFEAITCPKIKDLTELGSVLRDLEGGEERFDPWPDPRMKEAFGVISLMNKKAFQDIFLLSNPVLNKNPFSSNFLNLFLRYEKPKPVGFFLTAGKLIVYYFKSLIHFMLYLIKFTLYKLFFHRFKIPAKGELILIDTFFLLEQIRKSGSFSDAYFPGLEDLLKRMHKEYAYLPLFSDYLSNKSIFGFFSALRILSKKQVPVLCEFKLLTVIDLVKLFYFILVYPLRVLRFAFTLDSTVHSRFLIRHELLDTIDQVTFYNFSRYLQGKRMGRLPYSEIKLISWYENLPLHKNLYRGLREAGAKAKIYGSQLFLFTENFPYVMPDEGEAEFGVIPDKILVNGPYYMPQESIFNYALGPSLRYASFFKTAIRRQEQKNILVLLSYYEQDILNILSLFEKLGQQAQFKDLIVKFHPVSKKNKFIKRLPSGAKIAEEDIYKLFQSTKIVVGAASGTLIEAVSLGIPVIVVRNDLRFKYNNTLPPSGKGVIWEEVSSAEELAEQLAIFIERLKKEPNKIAQAALGYKKIFFNQPTAQKIIDAFDLS